MLRDGPSFKQKYWPQEHQQSSIHPCNFGYHRSKQGTPPPLHDTTMRTLRDYEIHFVRKIASVKTHLYSTNWNLEYITGPPAVRRASCARDENHGSIIGIFLHSPLNISHNIYTDIYTDGELEGCWTIWPHPLGPIETWPGVTLGESFMLRYKMLR